MTTATKSLPMVLAPADDDFDGDFKEAPDLKEWAEHLIDKHPSFNFLRVHTVEVLWKRKGGGAGNPKLGKCVKPKGMVRFFSGADFVIWLAADHIRERQEQGEWSARETEAALFHELCHASEDDDGNPKVVGHDAELFAAEVREHGFWTPALEQVRDAVQLRMGW